MTRSQTLLLAMATAVLMAAAVADASAQSSNVDAGSDGDVRVAAVAGDRTYVGAEGELRVEAPRLAEPDIDVDGVLDESDWEHAALLRGFTQFEPNEGLPATEDTEILVLVAKDAIYFGVRAHDSSMGEIRATLAERDGFTRNDDFVRFVLDTFDDQRRAYVFSVNPYGVQHDGLWVEGGGGERRGFGPPIDDNPDFVWESDARMHGGGWTAELRIPFKSLRFPDRAIQDWGFNVTRTIQRRGFQQSWAPLSSNAANQLTQSGRLAGLRDLDPGLFLEINPVATGKRVGTFDEDEGGLVHGGFEDEYGVNLTYGITSNLTLDGTINPDFSQVEADAGQIVVNERFPVFFPEKRPFFLEGTEIFSLPANLIYTRSIADPIAGAKLTGKVGSLNVGYLGAVDQFSEGSDAVVNIVRARHDVGRSSTLGLLYTDRTRTGDDYNRVAGADARFVLGGRYTLTLLGAASRTADPERAEAGDAVPDAGPDVGTFFVAGIERAGRGLTFRTEVEDAAPDFHAGSGFLRRTGDAQVTGEVRVSRYGAPDALVEVISPALQFRGFWDHDDFWAGERLKEGQIELGSRISFRNNITLFVNYTRGLFDYDAAAYDGLYVVPEGGAPEPFRPDQSLFGDLDGGRVFLWLNPWEKVRGNVRVNWEEGPIFDRAFGVPVEPGRSLSGELSLNLFPTAQLQGEIGVRHSRIERSDGARYSIATIPRVRAQYQFSRALFARTIVEYSAQEREAPRDPVTGAPLGTRCETECELRGRSDANDFHVEGLVGYEPTPGTVFYLGYTRDMEEPEAFGFRDLEPRAEGLFVKLSYRLRF